MKRLLITISLILALGITYGQEITKGADGLYYSPDQQLYSGPWREYYPGGQQLKMQMSIKQGQIDGQVILFFSNGQIQEIRSYQMGQMHGQWTKWNENGQQMAIAHYLNGNKDGKWYIWDENGTLLYDMEYKNGQRSGTWRMFDEQGQLVSEKSFD
ncbi:MAG: toxin-antitoxin system YwqK family antitoxin [Bacteroidales bacterium]